MGSQKQTSRAKRNSLAPKTCEIPGCVWSICVQRHRIKPGREGGKYVLGNVVALCPNHHWLADRELLTRDELQAIVDARIEQIIREEQKRLALLEEEYGSESRGTGEDSEAGYLASEASGPGDGSGTVDAPDGDIERQPTS